MRTLRDSPSGFLSGFVKMVTAQTCLRHEVHVISVFAVKNGRPWIKKGSFVCNYKYRELAFRERENNFDLSGLLTLNYLGFFFF